MKDRIKAKRDEGGFTMIELLVVIVILGILAAVVVFAVQGLGDKGQASACSIDERTVRTAEEAYFAKNGTYVDSSVATPGPLVPAFLSKASTLHSVSGATATAYSINNLGACV